MTAQDNVVKLVNVVMFIVAAMAAVAIFYLVT